MMSGVPHLASTLQVLDRAEFLTGISFCIFLIIVASPRACRGVGVRRAVRIATRDNLR